MSSSLYWRPAPKDPPPRRHLPFGLKKAIAQRIWGHDGSLYGDAVEIDLSWTMYFEGLRDAGNSEIAEGAREVLAALAEHGKIELLIAG